MIVLSSPKGRCLLGAFLCFFNCCGVSATATASNGSCDRALNLVDDMIGWLDQELQKTKSLEEVTNIDKLNSKKMVKLETLFKSNKMTPSTKPSISWELFSKLRFQIAKVKTVDRLKKARNPSYKVTFFLGEEQTKTSCGQFVDNYREEELINQQIACITNFEPRRIAGVKSQALTLGFPDKPNSHQAIILSPKDVVEEGVCLNFTGPSFQENESFDHFLALDVRSATIEKIIEFEKKLFALLDLGNMGNIRALIPGSVREPGRFVGQQVPALINLDAVAVGTDATFCSVVFVAPLTSGTTYAKDAKSLLSIKTPATIITITKTVENGLGLF